MSSLPNVRMESSPNKSSRKWGRKIRVSLFAFIIPNMVCIGYYAFVAKPVYVAHSTLMISNPAKDSATMSSILSGTAGEADAGGYVFKNFVQSLPEYKKLNKQYDLASLYSYGPDIIRGYGGIGSFFQRNDSVLYEYYNSHLSASVDEESGGLVHLEVLAPEPIKAEQISNSLLSDARAYISDMNKEEEIDFTKAASIDVEKSKVNLQKDEEELSKFRGLSGIYDPKTYYSSLMAKVEELEVKDIGLKSEYSSIVHDTPNNPVAQQYVTQMNVFKNEINNSNNIVSSQNSNFANYDALVIRQKQDAELLQSALSALQSAEIKDSQNHYYLKVIQSSQTLNSPERPHSLFWGLLVFAFSLMFLRVFW